MGGAPISQKGEKENEFSCRFIISGRKHPFVLKALDILFFLWVKYHIKSWAVLS
jgi:hypothetical protein